MQGTYGAHDPTQAVGSQNTLSSCVLPVFPGDDVTNRELEEWFDAAIPALSRAGYDAILRGEIPASLLPYTYRPSETGLVELSADGV